MTTTGVPADLPMSSPAAAASSSATARTVARRSLRWRSRVPRRSASAGTPNAPMATLVSPKRQGLPNVSLMTPAMRRGQAAGGAVGISWEERDGIAARDVGVVHTPIGAHEPKARLDNEDTV